MQDKVEADRLPEKTASAAAYAVRRGIASEARPQVRGKVLFTGEQKLYLRGVTYGTFRPLPAGDQYPPLEIVPAAGGPRQRIKSWPSHESNSSQHPGAGGEMPQIESTVKGPADPATTGKNVDTPPRLESKGKFLVAVDAKFYVKGVTYGAFRPDQEGREYTDLARIEADFVQMAASGFNAVRIPHTMPPRSLLDTALDHGLKVPCRVRWPLLRP